MRRVVVIGGGISGLAVAHRLHRLARERRLPLEISVLESEARFGGVIDTQSREGFLLEGGPDAFLSEKPWAAELCREVGLGEELMGTTPAHQRSLLVHQGRVVALPEGVWLVAPQSLSSALHLRMLSWAGRLRIACEPFIPARRDEQEESVGAFLRRRFGREAFERLGQPMISGITTSDPDHLSLRAAMPAWEEMERRYGSVAAGLRARARDGDHQARRAGGPRYSLFQTLRSGMGALVERLLSTMPGVRLERGARVASLAPGRPWTLELRGGRTLQAEAVCVALPAPGAAALTRPFAPEVAEPLERIPYESVAVVNLAFRAADCPRLPEGFGMVAPQCEQRRFVGITFSSAKFAGRAPQACVLLRAFMGGALQRAVLDLDDPQLTRAVLEELRELLGMGKDPILTSVRRHPRAMPQYHLGHAQRVAAIEAAVPAHPGLHLTGNWLRGVGLPDCVHEAQRTAERIAAEMV